jgi:hypothetical protein
MLITIVCITSVIAIMAIGLAAQFHLTGMHPLLITIVLTNPISAIIAIIIGIQALAHYHASSAHHRRSHHSRHRDDRTPPLYNLQLHTAHYYRSHHSAIVMIDIVLATRTSIHCHVSFC